MKLTELLDEYLALRFMRAISSENYRSSVARFLSSESINNEDLRIEELNEIILARWRDEIIHKRGRSIVTYNTYRNHLNVLFRYAVKRGHLSKNPFEFVGRAKSPTLLPKCIDFATYDAAIARINVHATDKAFSRATRLKPQWYWQAVLKTLLLTGMRRGQLIGLRWGDVDFERSLIRLRHETSKNHVEHFIPLFAQLRDDFLNLRRRALEVRTTIRDTDQVFDCAHFRDLAKYRGRSELNVADIKAFFQKLSDEIGVKITPHRLRHTAATELAMSTLDLRAIQKLLGHQTDRTTLTYIRSKTDDIQDLWDRRCRLGGVSRHVDKSC
ncbi:MAG: site-specific integrase [Betaproteobacteria bacterium]|nr:MAG: site-specific integrase [Betaproteobacteria bacterium]